MTKTTVPYNNSVIIQGRRKSGHLPISRVHNREESVELSHGASKMIA